MTRTKPKLLFFTSFPPPNTGQTIASNLIFKTLQNQGSFDLYKINTSDPNKLKRKGSSLSYVKHLCISYLRLIKTLNSKKIQTVYVVFSSTKSGLLRDVLSVIFIKYLNFKRIRLMAHLHSGNYGHNFKRLPFKYLFRFLLRNTDKLIFLSRSLNHIANFFPEDKSAYLTNMIDEDIICTEDEINRKFLNKSQTKDSFQIIYLSNMIPEKGFLDLNTAMGHLRTKNARINFHVKYIGGWAGEDKRNAFEKICINSENIKSEVVGPIYDRKILKQIFLDADIFVLPTYYPIEAQPLSIIEALNSGTPVISTWHAAIPEMIENGTNGLLIKPKSTHELAKAILELADRKKWFQYSESARDRYINTFSKSVLQNSALEIFNA